MEWKQARDLLAKEVSYLSTKGSQAFRDLADALDQCLRRADEADQLRKLNANLQGQLKRSRKKG